MSAQHLWIAPGDVVTDITERVLLPEPGNDGFRVASQAEEGSVGSSDVQMDDPDGTFYVPGLNAYRIKETTSEADDPYLFAGHFGPRKETRGTYRTLAGRVVNTQVQDVNALLSRYVIHEDEDGDRPQETDAERWEWLRGTGVFPAGSDFDDSLFIIDPAGVTLSAADLTDYTAQQIIDDMAQQSGRNFYVYWDGVEEKYLVVYALDSGTHLTSDLRFSNVEADHDGTTTFARNIGLDWELDISPERIAQYVVVRYANGRVSADNDDFEFGRVDRVMDANLIKTASTATARAIEYINDLDTEESVVSGTVYLPAAKASQFRAGMRCEMKATHLTGMADFVWVRLLSVTVVQLGEDPTLSYALAFEGTFSPPMSCSTVLAGLVAQEDGGTQSGGLGSHSDDDAGGPVAPGVDPYLAFAFMMMYEPHGTSITDITVDSPWNAGTGKPGTTGGTHTETMVAWRKDATGTPNFVITGICDYWRQIAVVVETSATSPDELTVNGTSGVITGATSGRLLLVFRMAEGPSGWNSDPTGADWVMLGEIDLTAIIQNNANMQLWACCVPDDTSGLGTELAGSSWWAHAWEMDIS